MKIKDKIQKETFFIFLCPALMWQFLFLYFPLVSLFFNSFFIFSPEKKTFVASIENYRKLLEPTYLKILSNSLSLAITTTLICLLIAYPVAYYLAFKVKRLKMAALMFMTLPSWTSIIIQIYAWFFLLKKGGIISRILFSLGITSNPIHMINNNFSIMVGMIYCYLPFMVLPIYSILERIDRKLIEASADLGGNRFTTMKKVIIPLSLPGILGGIGLVFIPAFGEFVIPELLGGSKQVFWGNIIVSKFMNYRDWNSGAATIYVGFLFPVLIIGISFLIVKTIKRVFRDKKMIFLFKTNTVQR
jgi:ABC-type spermidine/putrescine transport system permease subunit I